MHTRLSPDVCSFERGGWGSRFSRSALGGLRLAALDSRPLILSLIYTSGVCLW